MDISKLLLLCFIALVLVLISFAATSNVTTNVSDEKIELASVPVTCNDSDGGKYIYVSGTTCLGTNCSNDYCVYNNQRVFEFYCQGNSKLKTPYDCPNGCNNGACIGSTPTSCNDPDGTLGFYSKTTVTTNTGDFLTDTCLQNGSPTVREYGCDNLNQILFTNYICPQGCTDGACREKPNFLLIISDDHDYDLLGFMGSTIALTPNIDEIAQEGAVFNNGVSTMALCRPAHASILNGQFPHENGIYFNYPGAMVPDTYLDPQNVFPKLLKDAGYNTFIGGKFWENDPTSYGFTHLGGLGTDFARVSQQSAMDFIDESHQQNKPFMIYYSPILPHLPHNPPQEYLDRFNLDDIPVPPWVDPSLETEFKQAEKSFLGTINWFDSKVGDVIQKLKDTNEFDNTVIIYFIDNGYANGFASKGTAFEKGVRTPIIIRTKNTALSPSNFSSLASVVDIPPTILDYAQIPIPTTYSGQSLKPVIEGTQPISREMIIEGIYAGDTSYGEIIWPNLADDVFSVFVKDTQNSKYIVYLNDLVESDNSDFALKITHPFVPFPARNAGFEEYYDLSLDRFEQNNRIADESLAEIIQNLRNEANNFIVQNNLNPSEGNATFKGEKPESILPQCIYNKAYSNPNECVCISKTPKLSIFESNDILCTPDGKTLYVCRNPELDLKTQTSFIPGEINITAKENVSFIQLKKTIEDEGGIIRKQPCTWGEKSKFNFLLVETKIGSEKSFMEKISSSGLANLIQQNPQLVCV